MTRSAVLSVFPIVGLALMVVAGPACSSNSAANSQGSAGNGAAGHGTGGAGGTTGAGGAGGIATGGGSGGTCPIYQAMCGGTCMPVANDPNNCGSCGNKCAAGQVCIGGGCSGSCLPGAGQTACAGQCVDTGSDNNNCGSCGHVCGANQGCVGGGCVAARVFPPPATCTGGGPSPTVGAGSTAKCAGLIAQTSFTWSVCSCQNITFDADALVDGWNSTMGGYKPHQLGGGMGANMSISSMSLADIYGQSWAAASSTAFNVSAFNVYDDIRSGGNISGDQVAAARDAYVVGNISGQMTVGGTLYQTPGKAHPGLTAVQQTVTVPPPCNCTSPIPVVDLVAWAKTNNNDAAIGLDPAIMTQAGHPSRIDLPCGVYYMNGFSSGGSIVAHGNVALFIDGSVTSSGDLVLTVADPTSAIDIFVSGTIVATSSFSLGNPSYPALTRLYIGGTQTLNVQSMLIIGAEIWAGNATVLWESDTDAFGSIFAGDLQVVSTFNLHYDQGVIHAGNRCPGGEGGGTGGTGGGGCATCEECGNQACHNGMCGMCTTSDECCAPLVCNGGTCSARIP
ncbi:MAG TPA: hypothetical protein VKQ32_10950 [Polyangia bacterium]|nr:hypothetical protein [Polyangia bacterium]